jgi:FkbM family methyltransferase
LSLVVRGENEINIINDFKIVIPCYNAGKYIDLCITSILRQTYKQYRCYIINDGSDDHTRTVLDNLISNDSRFRVITHEKKHNPVYSLQKELPYICDKDSDIIVLVDGDDWLFHPGVLSFLNNVYQNTGLLLTYGQYLTSNDFSVGCSRDLIDIKHVRNSGVNFSHLRTFKYGLWRYIKVRDLQDDDKQYYPMAGDTAYMLPMIEMAGLDRIAFIDRILYAYNTENRYSEVQVDAEKQIKIDEEIRKKEPYPKLRIASELKVEEKQIIKDYIKQGHVVFDVGSNIGNWIKVVLEYYDRVHGHCFEPIKEIFDYLKWVVDGCDVECTNMALGAEDANKDFFYYKTIPELSTLYRRATKIEQDIIQCDPIVIKVPVIRLDDYCAKYQISKIDFLKVDVEGAELDVFKGSESMIKNGMINYILLEYGGCNLDSKISLFDIWQWFLDKPFDWYKVRKGDLLKIDNYNKELEDYEWSNYLLKRNRNVQFNEKITL